MGVIKYADKEPRNRKLADTSPEPWALGIGGMSGVLCFCSLISGPSMFFDKMAQNFAAHVLKSSKGNLFQCLTVVIFLYIFF